MFRGSNLLLGILIPIIIFIQVSVIPLISVNNVAPDLLIVLISYYTIRNGQFYGTAFGAIAGLSFDLISGTLLGSMMLAKVLAAFAIGYFYNELKSEEHINSPAFALITLFGSLIDSLVTGLISSSSVASNGVTFVLSHGLFPALFTALFAAFVTVFHPKRRLVR